MELISVLSRLRL